MELMKGDAAKPFSPPKAAITPSGGAAHHLRKFLAQSLYLLLSLLRLGPQLLLKARDTLVSSQELPVDHKELCLEISLP